MRRRKNDHFFSLVLRVDIDVGRGRGRRRCNNPALHSSPTDDDDEVMMMMLITAETKQTKKL